jgi:hypothetical protein
LAIEFTDASLDCKTYFRLQAKWEGTYTDWEDVVPELEAKVALADFALSSYVSFGDTSGDLHAGFSNRDVEELAQYFTFQEGGVDVTAF